MSGYDRHTLPDADLTLALETFVRMVGDLMGDELVSVVLYGSICFDDLAPGYGDLDFIAVVADDLTDDQRRGLVDLRKQVRGAEASIYEHMLEGAFLPRAMLDPSVPGRALWWGTSGERDWGSNALGWLVLHVIRERGIVIWGEDVRKEVPYARRMDLLEDVRAACRSMREHGCGGTLHSVDWLLTAARLLLWLREGKLSSKTEAARWGALNAAGTWRELLPRASELRRRPELSGAPGATEWLAELSEPILQACSELEQALLESEREA